MPEGTNLNPFCFKPLSECGRDVMHGHPDRAPIRNRFEGTNDRGEFGMPGVGGTNPVAWGSGPGRLMMPSDVAEDPPYQINIAKNMVVTEDAAYIMTHVLPGLIVLFLEKNRKYASVEKGYDLGDRGIIPDINRKVGILVDRIWHGNEEIGESTDEVIDDLIGHLLLMKAKRRS